MLTNHVGDPQFRSDFHKLHLTQFEWWVCFALVLLPVLLLRVWITLAEWQNKAFAPLSDVIADVRDDARLTVFWQSRIADVVDDFKRLFVHGNDLPRVDQNDLFAMLHQRERDIGKTGTIFAAGLRGLQSEFSAQIADVRVLEFVPPLIITEEQIVWCLETMRRLLIA